MLSDAACKNAKPKDKIYAVTDGGGMYLEIHPNGSKYWRMKYRYAGKQKRIAFGVYPEVSLKEARAKKDAARKTLKNGEDPSIIKKKAKIEFMENVVNTFENVAREWFDKKKAEVSEKYASKIISRLEYNIFPFLGSTPIKKISPRELLTVIRKIEEKGAIVTARIVTQYVGQIFRYAIAADCAEHDITADLKGALRSAKIVHYPHFSEKEFREFLKNLPGLRGEELTKLALKLLILTFVRNGELCGARWNEFDFERREWRIPAERMKMKEQHIVHLSTQSVAVIEKIKEIACSDNLLFPNRDDKSATISKDTLACILRKSGYCGKMTPHGIRATASTILNENGFRADIIERQLAHTERNNVRASYNHAQYLPERREMMDWWGDYVEKLEGKW
ncbi:MAG: tyrosine-type recombinase/integrase [Holosporaceae bacterium]|jgi:integrase|nr:tyrosine-type recombinase/integrase [Holosporaceae bacterium]